MNLAVERHCNDNNKEHMQPSENCQSNIELQAGANVGYWPKVTVGLCYRQAAVRILGRNLSGSLRARERIRPTGQERKFDASKMRQFERLLHSKSSQMAYVN
jgi:hypothetical protein